MTTEQSPTARQASFQLPVDLLDRLDAQANRLMIGRQLIAERGLTAIVAHLERLPDPLSGLSIAPSGAGVPNAVPGGGPAVVT